MYELRLLTAQRERLIGMIKKLKVAIEEEKGFVVSTLSALIATYSVNALAASKNDLILVGQRVKQCIKADVKLRILNGLICSVSNVG